MANTDKKAQTEAAKKRNSPNVVIEALCDEIKDDAANLPADKLVGAQRFLFKHMDALDAKIQRLETVKARADKLAKGISVRIGKEG